MAHWFLPTRKVYTRTSDLVPINFLNPMHLKLVARRVVWVVKDRITWLSGDCKSGPLDRYVHPSLIRRWVEYVFGPLSKPAAKVLDKRLNQWYLPRVILVLTTRMQYLFDGVRYSTWVLNRSEHFLRPWPLNKRRQKR